MTEQYYELTRGFEARAQDVAVAVHQELMLQILLPHPTNEWARVVRGRVINMLCAATASGPNGRDAWHEHADPEIRDCVRILYAAHVDRILQYKATGPDLTALTPEQKARIEEAIQQSVIDVGLEAFGLIADRSWLKGLPPGWDQSSCLQFWSDYFPMTATFMLERIAWAWLNDPAVDHTPGHYYTFIRIVNAFPDTLFPIVDDIIVRTQQHIDTVRLRRLFSWLIYERSRNPATDELYRRLSLPIASELDKRDSAET